MISMAARKATTKDVKEDVNIKNNSCVDSMMEIALPASPSVGISQHKYLRPEQFSLQINWISKTMMIFQSLVHYSDYLDRADLSTAED
jgi:hypothetical protein